MLGSNFTDSPTWDWRLEEDLLREQFWTFTSEAISQGPPGDWIEPMREACYSCSGNNEDARDWLVQDWVNTNVDLEPLFQLYRVGGSYNITDSGVVVVEQRPH